MKRCNNCKTLVIGELFPSLFAHTCCFWFVVFVGDKIATSRTMLDKFYLLQFLSVSLKDRIQVFRYLKQSHSVCWMLVS